MQWSPSILGFAVWIRLVGQKQFNHFFVALHCCAMQWCLVNDVGCVIDQGRVFIEHCLHLCQVAAFGGFVNMVTNRDAARGKHTQSDHRAE